MRFSCELAVSFEQFCACMHHTHSEVYSNMSDSQVDHPGTPKGKEMAVETDLCIFLLFFSFLLLWTCTGGIIIHLILASLFCKL
jgi:hypothetical protein